MKKLWIIPTVIALMLTLAIFALPISAETVIYSGSCGEDLTWTLDSGGTLVISGTGPMDFDNHFRCYEETVAPSNKSISPWYYLPSGTVTSVEIQNGVTNIAYRAFHGLHELTSVKIADSVTVIETEAFYSCESIETVTFGTGLTEIRRSAFGYCEALTDAYLPDGLITIEGDAFMGCNALQRVRIPASVQEIGSDAFKWCRQLHTVAVESPTIAKAAADSSAVGQLFCHPIHVWVGKSVTSVGAQIRSHYAAGETVTENGISYTDYAYKPAADADWEIDDAHHFLSCDGEGCGAILFSQAHVWENDCDEYCNVCNYYSEKSHGDSTAYLPVSGGHQLICEYCREKLSSKVEPHNWGDSCWGEECSDCGATRTAPGHDFGDWESDSLQHRRECARCHWVERGEHSGDEVCTDCGWVNDGANDHIFGDILTYDESFHWWQCSHCDAIMGKGQHVMDAGVMTVEPTATKEGEMRYSCTECDYTFTEIVPALGGVTEPPATEPIPPVTEEAPPITESGNLYPPSVPSLDGEYTAKPQIKIIWAPWALPAIIGGVLLAAVAVILLILWKKKKKSR